MTETPERDEFDEIAGRGGPVGVHRAPRPWYTRVVAPLLVFLLAGAAAFLIAQYLWSQDVAAEPDPTATSTTSVTATPTTTSPSPTATSPSATPSPTPTETATIEFDASVAVLNGAGITGLASANQKILEEAGFTEVSAGNLTGDKPDANVVVYTSESLRATAQEVAQALGVDSISFDVATTEADVEVHLVSDPAA